MLVLWVIRMINDITIGQYIPGESILHRADPRVKILLTAIFIATLFFLDTYVDLCYSILCCGIISEYYLFQALIWIFLSIIVDSYRFVNGQA